MAASTPLLTAGAIAKQFGAADAKVKKAIAALGLEPAEKKGACCYYDAAAVKKIQAALKA